MGEIMCKVIGIIHFVDDGEIDYKVIGVDAQFKGCKDINELSDLKNYPVFADAEAKIMNWLKFYKTVDNEGIRIENAEKKYGKMIKGRSTSAAEAKKVIQECREGYKHINDDGARRESKWYRDLKWQEDNKE
jgi:inorganic pyrophosphatase